MAGNKISKRRDEQTKKRKRELSEADSQPKRSKAQDSVKLNDAPAPTTTTANGDLESGEIFRKADPVKASDTLGNKVAASHENAETGWRVSKPMGGRMVDIDPILTDDEEYLILAYNTSIQVYTAADSLLLRRIPITTLDTATPMASVPTVIVSVKLSHQNPEYVWVACSDGNIYHVNWKGTTGPLQCFQTVTGTAKGMSIIPTNGSGKSTDTILVVESEKSTRLELNIYGNAPASPSSRNILALKKPGNGLQLIESSTDGRVLVGALNDRLFLGVALHGQTVSFEQLQYEFFSFDVPDVVTALDLRVHSKSGGSGGRIVDTEPVVDIIVGGARGSIYLYHNALSRSQSLGKSGAHNEAIQAQKYHWHRKAVHAVKWSRDGNYMISGGSENVLVIWQMDTSKKDFLPHLSGSVENIVVSARGSSYVVHLDDNSAMILSTAEMKPTAYVSGIQSAAVDFMTPKDLLVQRVWSAPKEVRRPIPAAIRPTEPSRLHICVGNGRQATMSGDFSAPLLQSFDLESFTSVSKQALSRTQPTDVNTSNKGHPIDEPIVTHIAFSGDGKWLASVDDWTPSARDVENVSGDIRDQFITERHEVYLKFWEVDGESDSIALVSRVNAPHATNRPERVLDLASNTASTCFATIGGDGMVRLWRPRTRQELGSKVSNKSEVAWACSQIIPVGDGLGRDAVTDLANDALAPVNAQGRIDFSDDGSTLFVAFGAIDTGALYVIDTASGEIIKVLEGLWKGQLQSIRALSQYVIVLSEELHVYDVVGDDLRYGIVVPNVDGASELLQLAVDIVSGHFAVTLPLGNVSSIGIFHPTDPEPLIVRTTPHRIVSLVSSPGTSGFLALDDTAQIWVISEGSDPTSILAAQPLQDLRLDSITEEADNKFVAVLNGEDEQVESDDEMEGIQANEDVDMEDDNEVHTNVVPQQYLADIFDAAPAFAGASIEDMFYKVTGLLSTKPLSTTPA